MVRGTAHYLWPIFNPLLYSKYAKIHPWNTCKVMKYLDLTAISFGGFRLHSLEQLFYGIYNVIIYTIYKYCIRFLSFGLDLANLSLGSSLQTVRLVDVRVV